MSGRAPLNNLSPMSQDWARWIEGQVSQTAAGLERMGGDASNDGRVNNSAMDNMALQINEIYQRQSRLIRHPNLNTPNFSEGSGDQTVSTSIILPRPTDKSRAGWVSVQVVPTQNNNLDSVAFITMDLDGRVFFRTSASLPPGLSTPAGWDGSTSVGTTGFVASPSGGGVVTVTMTARGQFFGSSGNRIVTLANIQATVQYGQAA